MNSRSLLSDDAYILHSYPYRNTSQLLEVFTRQHGRVGLIAKGARQASSPLYGKLQSFTRLQIQWPEKAELSTLYQVEAQDRHGSLLPVDKLLYGYYVNELLLKLLHRHDPHSELFDDYAATLHLLAEHFDEVILRYFELSLLENMGYGMNLEMDANSHEAVEPQANYQYIIEKGPIRLHVPAGETFAVSGDALLALATRSIKTDTQRREARLLMRMIIDHYLGDRELKTREMFRQQQLL